MGGNLVCSPDFDDNLSAPHCFGTPFFKIRGGKVRHHFPCSLRIRNASRTLRRRNWHSPSEFSRTGMLGRGMQQGDMPCEPPNMQETLIVLNYLQRWADSVSAVARTCNSDHLRKPLPMPRMRSSPSPSDLGSIQDRHTNRRGDLGECDVD